MWLLQCLVLALAAAVHAQTACPANTVGTPGRCSCDVGFTGTITWNAQTRQYVNNCRLAPCPANSAAVLSGTRRSCTCNSGFITSAAINWDANRRVWTGGCRAAPCPPNAVASNPPGRCTCHPNYNAVGLRFAANVRRWIGTCTIKPGLCPANAAGNPCRCIAGFTGSLVLSRGRWIGTCTRGTPGTPGGNPNTSPCSNVRREWYTLSPAEQSLYLEAVAVLSTRVQYRTFLSQHIRPVMDNYAHRGDGFFPWHRWFLYQFEELLRSLGPRYRCVSIPYWDWSRSGTALGTGIFNSFGGSFTGCMRTLGGRRFGFNCVSRRPAGGFGVNPGILNQIATSGSFSRATTIALGPHNRVHNSIGGTMATTGSCFDPIFMAHHAFVDYQWSIYYRCRNARDLGGAGAGNMPGFDRTTTAPAVVDTRRIGRGYSYAPSAFELSGAFRSVCPAAAGASDLQSNNLSPSAQIMPPYEYFLPSMFPIDDVMSRGQNVSDYMPNLDSLKFSEKEVEYIETLHLALKELEPSGAAPNSSVLLAASRLACIQTKSTFEYSECTDFGKNMCSCERELESMTLEPCATLPTGGDLRKLRQQFIEMDADCMEIMQANIAAVGNGTLED